LEFVISFHVGYVTEHPPYYSLLLCGDYLSGSCTNSLTICTAAVTAVIDPIIFDRRRH